MKKHMPGQVLAIDPHAPTGIDGAASEAQPAPTISDGDAAMPLKPNKSVPAVNRAVAILWYLAKQQEPRTLSQIARATGIVPSTGLHILRELQVTRIVTVDRSHKLYSLGPGLIELAHTASRNFNVVEVVRPTIHAIAYRHNLTSTVTAVLDDAHATCIASVSPPDATSINVTPGGRVPKYSGAAGRCFAAYSGAAPDVLKSYFERIRWHEPINFETWLAEIEAVPRLGYAKDIGQFAKGVTSLAAPVILPDRSVTLVIGISTISAALDKQSMTSLLTDLVNGAREIAQLL